MELLRAEKDQWELLLNCESWPLFERVLMEQMNQRAEAVLLNTNITDREREFLRGELSFGMFAATLPKEMIASAQAALELLYQEDRAQEGEEVIDDVDDDDSWRID